MIPYSSIRFGLASAEDEGASEPNLLLAGFFDVNGISGDARSSRKFLVLGYKGSGKSALSEHLRLTADSDPQFFTVPTFLADFPYHDFSRLFPGDDPQAKFPTAWAWLLLVRLFESLSRDEGKEPNAEFENTVEVLKKLGVIPGRSLRDVVLTSSTRTFKVKLPVVFESEFRHDRHEQILKFPHYVEHLKRIINTVRSRSRHLLIIDGLDDIFTAERIQYDSLAALLLEVSRLNATFTRESVPAKILLLCRTDLFEKLPGANKNKLRQDSAIMLDWYQDPRQPGESNLVRLDNLKARVSDHSLADVFTAYFPGDVRVRGGSRRRRGGALRQAIVPHLLEFTRHTPRDFIQVLTHIQRFERIQERYTSLIRRRLTEEQVLSGLRSYSIDYFLPEIKDELVGYFPASVVEAAFSLIGSLRKREFSFDELRQKAVEQPRFRELDLPGIVSALFECSAVGNVNTARGTRRAQYFTWKYRNRNSTLDLQESLLLHKGMWRALNVG
jgi:hypothetical protein